MFQSNPVDANCAIQKICQGLRRMKSGSKSMLLEVEKENETTNFTNENFTSSSRLGNPEHVCRCRSGDRRLHSAEAL